jgi:hypothetical protein
MDDNDSAASDDASSTTLAEDVAAAHDDPTFSDPELAAEVHGPRSPDPEPPPADTAKDALEKTTRDRGRGRCGRPWATRCRPLRGQDVRRAGVRLVVGAGRALPGDARSRPAAVIAGWNEGLVGVKIVERAAW